MTVIHSHHKDHPRSLGHGDPLMDASAKYNDQGDQLSECIATSLSTDTPTDPLFREVRHHDPRPDQILPIYSEFRLGHGDPMMKAAMKHWHDDMIPHSPRPPPFETTKPRRRSLLSLGPPLYQWTHYFTDVLNLEKSLFQDRVVAPLEPKDEKNNSTPSKTTKHVHIGKDTIITFPNLPTEGDEKKTEPVSELFPDVRLKEHGSPLYFYNDHVHISKDEMMTFPCFPTEEFQDTVETPLEPTDEKSDSTPSNATKHVPIGKDTIITFPNLPTEADKQKTEPLSEPLLEVKLKEHGSPLCFYNDHVHISKDEIVTFPCLPTED
jgi:hypothetical protein